MKIVAMLLLVVAVGGCVTMVEGKDTFKAAAFHRAGSFSMNYQSLFKCFTDKEPAGRPLGPIVDRPPGGPIAGLYPDLGMAEYKMAKANSWGGLIEFRHAGPGQTIVDGWMLYEYVLNDLWASVEACGRGK